MRVYPRKIVDYQTLPLNMLVKNINDLVAEFSKEEEVLAIHLNAYYQEYYTNLVKLVDVTLVFTTLVPITDIWVRTVPPNFAIYVTEKLTPAVDEAVMIEIWKEVEEPDSMTVSTAYGYMRFDWLNFSTKPDLNEVWILNDKTQ